MLHTSTKAEIERSKAEPGNLPENAGLNNIGLNIIKNANKGKVMTRPVFTRSKKLTGIYKKYKNESPKVPK